MDISSQENLLTELESNLVMASSGQRFLNYIIDFIVFYIFILGLGLVLGLVFPAALEGLAGINPLMDRLFTLVLYGLFMGSVEVITKGRSLGKLITKTKAVNEDGTTISTSTAFLRGFSRAVPFNQLSALGNPPHPWHDKWNKTYVIDIKDSFIVEKQ
jgi:uncharacterized RDD family membrane protein YckC